MPWPYILWQPGHPPHICACGAAFVVDHMLSCSLRHNEIRDLTARFLCNDMQIEPELQEITIHVWEKRKYHKGYCCPGVVDVRWTSESLILLLPQTATPRSMLHEAREWKDTCLRTKGKGSGACYFRPSCDDGLLYDQQQRRHHRHKCVIRAYLFQAQSIRPWQIVLGINRHV